MLKNAKKCQIFEIKKAKLENMKNIIALNRILYKNYLSNIWDKIDLEIKKINDSNKCNDDLYSYLYELQEKSEIIAFQLALEYNKANIDTDYIINYFDESNGIYNNIY